MVPVRSLFKTPPIENLDLKTNTNKNSKTSVPAKYIMITGSKTLSPNNVIDLAAATKKSNVNGENVKVILISQAGSEGLDFKFIRQVHIIEPWYNLSRIEQIIGRAVRNCSHKDLPFEKRNVEIFLYGTILPDKKEAADLYVYRLAEQKSIQVGYVNRVLKEIAVDCLLNSDQLNFTAEKIQQNVRLLLSNKTELEYAIGDKPYSSQCDYMPSCLYKCKPTNEIGKVNELSYSQAFIDMNSEKIIHRIKQIMKDGYYFEKMDLINRINVIKPFPITQIYSALTYLVSDKNEIITDKYGRTGNLINIGEYYFFQPIELNNENISLYEREVPIPFKHSDIPYKTPEKPIAQKIITKIAKVEEVLEADIADDPANLTAIIDGDEKIDVLTTVAVLEKPKIPIVTVPATSTAVKNNIGKELLKTMLKNYNTSNSDKLIVRGETDWYKFSAIVLKELHAEQIPKEILEELLISHIIETLLFDDLLNVINYIYGLTDELTSV